MYKGGERESGHIEISVLWRTDPVSWNFTTSQRTIRSGQHKRLTELIAFVERLHPTVARLPMVSAVVVPQREKVKSSPAKTPPRSGSGPHHLRFFRVRA